jgi:Rod binding domain-containing protein
MDGIDGIGAPPGLARGSLPNVSRLDASMPPEKVRAVAQQLEGVFMSMLVEQMRSSMTEDGLFGSGPGADTYGGLFDRYIGESMSKGSRLGIAEMVVRSVNPPPTHPRFAADQIAPGLAAPAAPDAALGGKS